MSFGSLVVVQPSLMDRTALTGGGLRLASAGSESLEWQPSLGMGVVLSDEKSLERTPRLSSESYDKYIAWTERHEVTSPLWGCVVSLAKNAPSIGMGERSSRENPHAMKSVIDHK